MADRFDDFVTGQRDLTLVSVESPHHTPGLGFGRPASARGASVLTRVRWRDGRREVTNLATVQAHGAWLDSTLQRT